eukprot:scaffold163707_cov49-Attheya_sp.AAC.1
MERNSNNNTQGRLFSLVGSVPSIHDDIHDLMSVCSQHNHDDDGATYRGRTAESGAAGRNHSAAEPKQSWEMKRCTCQCQAITIPSSREEQGSSSGVTVTVPEEESWLLARRKLVDWTRDLHQVATVIMELLFLETTVPPPQQQQQQPQPLRPKEDNDTVSSQHNIWLEPQPCAAVADSKQIHDSLSLLNHASMTNNKPRTTCCNVDLLRAFCYDAVELEEDDGNNPTKDDDARLLGSSPHTDWGTLTVVWQDSKGGLQTYCHAHDQWTNVEVATNADTTTDATDTTTTNEEEKLSQTKNTSDTMTSHHPNEEEDVIISLFVHMGDFTSLATRGAWPSPRHRVVCPIRPRTTTTSSHHHDNTLEDVRETCRCSLVYFAYPPPGVTLGMAQDAFQQQLVWTSKMNKDDEPDKDGTIPFSQYSVLQNQSNVSQQQAKNAEQIMYQRIQSIPFDQVIQDKWNQVQRAG